MALAEDEITKLIDHHVETSWTTNDAKLISQISHEDLEEAIKACDEEEAEEKRDEDKDRKKDDNESGEGDTDRHDVTKTGEPTQKQKNSKDNVIRKAQSVTRPLQSQDSQRNLTLKTCSGCITKVTK